MTAASSLPHPPAPAHSPHPPAPAGGGRWPVLLYGALVYALFLCTFLYAIGFVNRFAVPRHIDSGAPAPLGEALWVNLTLLGLFATQHMVMARQWFKRRVTRVIPPAAERSTFVLATCVLLGAMYGLWRPLPEVIWSVPAGAPAVLLEALSWAGWGLVLVATFLIDHFDLFGLKQVLRHFRGRPHAEPAFRVHSIYRHTRHPLYVGFLLAFWSTAEMTGGRLLFALATTGFILIAVRLEERDLVRAHGRRYEEYRRAVPMLLPSLTRRYPALTA